jgi:hypothetical protein
VADQVKGAAPGGESAAPPAGKADDTGLLDQLKGKAKGSDAPKKEDGPKPPDAPGLLDQIKNATTDGGKKA